MCSMKGLKLKLRFVCRVGGSCAVPEMGWQPCLRHHLDLIAIAKFQKKNGIGTGS